MSLPDKLVEYGAVYCGDDEVLDLQRYVLFDGEDPVVEVRIDDNPNQVRLLYNGAFERIDIEHLVLEDGFDFGDQIAGVALELLHLRPDRLKHVTGPWIADIVSYHNAYFN